ncbi:hypothetical protein QYE76_040873 [Lolium multiflorum]|uniref:Uncharacterized protein n=1 Tax=Lolium multiflorum TaxID=4521 RepID=A0AAD8WTG3_LOLMU|nr:hypothetical protein QYE76_040873 [Lolium multiflorum]
MHLYLGLLKEELATLWQTPARTWDAYKRDYFPLRAALLTTVQDYPGYAYVSCQVNHGFKACVKCMDKTPHLQLPKPPGSCKTVFQGTRMWLRFDHPWRKRKDLFNGEEELGRSPRPRSGEEISELLENWEECPAPGKKRPRESPLLGVWNARSVFWDLPYWKVLHTPHSLDVMHITKNVTESLLGTLMNMPDDGKHKFKHVFEFPCVKQPENSTLDAFYVMHHLKGFVRDSQNLRLPSALRGWAEKLARINDDDLREDFQDTRVKLSHIIIQDVTTGGGPLHQGRALCKRDIEHRLKAQGDTRTWITKDLYKPFPEPCEP